MAHDDDLPGSSGGNFTEQKDGKTYPHDGPWVPRMLFNRRIEAYFGRGGIAGQRSSTLSTSMWAATASAMYWLRYNRQYKGHYGRMNRAFFIKGMQKKISKTSSYKMLQRLEAAGLITSGADADGEEYVEFAYWRDPFPKDDLKQSPQQQD